MSNIATFFYESNNRAGRQALSEPDVDAICVQVAQDQKEQPARQKGISSGGRRQGRFKRWPGFDGVLQRGRAELGEQP